MDGQTRSERKGQAGAAAGGIAGLVASGFAAACCLGAAPVLGLLVTLGLGFLISDIILVPMLVVAIAVVVWSAARITKRSGVQWPFTMAIISGVVTIAGVWVSAWLSGIGIAGLAVATAVPLIARRIAVRNARRTGHQLYSGWSDTSDT